MRVTIANLTFVMLSVLLFLHATATPAFQQDAGTPIAFETVLRHRSSRILQKKNVVVTNPQDWQKLWKKMGFLETPIPEIDFSQRTLIAVFNGESGDANNLVEITRVEKIGKAYQVFARENHTHPTCPPPPPVTSTSFHLIVVEKIKNPERRVEFRPHEHQSIPCL